MNHLLRAAAALLLPVFALGAAPAHAQDSFRVGFVNPDRVLREAQPAGVTHLFSFRRDVLVARADYQAARVAYVMLRVFGPKRV